jgi:hypothetical protein
MTKWYQMSLDIKVGEYYIVSIPFDLIGAVVGFAAGFAVGKLT